MDYKQEQLTTASRYRNNIRSYKILQISGDNLIFRISNNSDETASFPVSVPESYKVGGYVDFCVTSQGRTSHTIRFIGHTPPKFIPENGEEIGD